MAAVASSDKSYVQTDQGSEMKQMTEYTEKQLDLLSARASNIAFSHLFRALPSLLLFYMKTRA